jgi:hypothetical protein
LSRIARARSCSGSSRSVRELASTGAARAESYQLEPAPPPLELPPPNPDDDELDDELELDELELVSGGVRRDV